MKTLSRLFDCHTVKVINTAKATRTLELLLKTFLWNVQRRPASPFSPKIPAQIYTQSE